MSNSPGRDRNVCDDIISRLKSLKTQIEVGAAAEELKELSLVSKKDDEILQRIKKEGSGF